MPAQAHVESVISHTNALSHLIEGVIIGAVVGAALGALTVATGGLALGLAVAGGAATGLSIGGTIGKMLGSQSSSPTGTIIEGSPNVRVNGKPAARCTSKASCSRHPGAGAALVAQGSANTFINGKPAARVGDMGTCSFKIETGSSNVHVGGDMGGCGLAIRPEVPPWVDKALMVSGVVGMVLGFGAAAVALRAAGMAGAQIAARLGLSLAGGKVMGDVGGAVGGHYFGEGSLGQYACALGGSVVGGWGGFKAGSSLDAVPRLNPFNYEPYAEPGTLGANGGNLRARYVGPETEGTGPLARPATGEPPPSSGSVIRAEGRHGDLKGTLEPGVQSHHLNQDAAFRPAIPRNDGQAIGIEGNAFTEPGTPHYEAHNAMEGFWNQYREGGPFEGDIPTNGEYSTALEESLRRAGIPESDIARQVELARANREAYGLTDADKIPRLPGRINQRRP